MNTARLQQLRSLMPREGLDALVCRLPENVVLLTGYWPVVGRSAAVLTLEHGPILLAPEMEAYAIQGAWAEDVHTFPVWRLVDPDPQDSLNELLAAVAARYGLKGRRVGYDGAFEDIAPTQRVAEPWAWASASIQALAGVLDAAIVDATPLLVEARAIKFPPDIARIKVANEVAGFGLDAFFASIDTGRTEADVAAALEYAILARGTGHQGTKHARGQAVVYSGQQRLSMSWGYTANTGRRLQPEDVVMIELAAVADGYWCDLTRMASVAPVDHRVAEVHDAVLAAQHEAVRTIRAGVKAAEVDAAARAVLRQRHLAHGFIQHTGHGVGFRYHEPIPWLHPSSTQTLTAGMVTSVEPAVYLDDVGGVRVEDNVLVTDAGAEILSARPPRLWGHSVSGAM